MYLDSGVLPAGGLTPGSRAWLPLCVSNADLRHREIRLDRVRYEALFDGNQLHFVGLTPDPKAFEVVIERQVDNVEGKLVYSAASAEPVTLPHWPTCLPIAWVQVRAGSLMQPGDVAVVLGSGGSVVREAVTLQEGQATRSGTYIDIVEWLRVYLPVVTRSAGIAP